MGVPFLLQHHMLFTNHPPSPFMPANDPSSPGSTAKTYYRFLGMPHNDILRGQSTIRVEQYKSEALGWKTALLAAKRFSGGRHCVMGQGTGLGGSRTPEIQGTFNICYWVQVDGLSSEWVVRFPLKGVTSDETTLRRMRS